MGDLAESGLHEVGRLYSILTHAHPIAMTSQAKLWLDPNTIILPAKGCLHVLNRRGATKIQADHIDAVHEKLKGYLDGNYQEGELILSVPAEKQSILEKYFTAMSQAGALQRGEVAPGIAGLTVQEDGCSLLVTLQNKKIFVCLDGADPACDIDNHSHDACLLFVTPQQMDTEWKRIWRAHKSGPHLLYVIEKDELANREEKKQYAIWLLGCSRMDSWEGRLIRLYTLNTTGPALNCFFQARLSRDPKGSKAETKKIASELVTVTDHDQIPLVSARATVPFYSNSVAGCGLEYNRLADNLEREFMVQAVLASEANRGKVSCVTELKTWQRSGTELRRTRVDQRQAARWPVAGSLLHLHLRALEQFWWESPESRQGSSAEINLLQRHDKHPQIAYLTDVLRTRLHALPARIQTTACGLHVCQSGKRLAYSLVEAKAIRDFLLAAVKDQFHRESLSEVGTKHECDFGNFLSEEELQQLALRQSVMLDERRVNRKFTLKRIHCYGISAWIGTLDRGSNGN